MEQNVAELPISHKAFAWFEQNKRQAAWGISIVAVAALVIWFVAWRRGEKEAQASRALSDVTLAQAGFSGPAKESPEAYLKIVSEYPNSAAGTRALLLAAGAFFNQGKYSDAEAQFQKFIRDYRESPLLGRALLGVAACLDAQGKTEQATTAYKDLISRHPTDSVIPQAKFSLARLYEAQNKPELARDLYEQVERDSRFTGIANEAGMRMEELIAKYPNLAPPPAPAPTPFSLTPTPARSNVMASTNPVVVLPASTNAPAASPKSN